MRVRAAPSPPWLAGREVAARRRRHLRRNGLGSRGTSSRTLVGRAPGRPPGGLRRGWPRPLDPTCANVDRRSHTLGRDALLASGVCGEVIGGPQGATRRNDKHDKASTTRQVQQDKHQQDPWNKTRTARTTSIPSPSPQRSWSQQLHSQPSSQLESHRIFSQPSQLPSQS